MVSLRRYDLILLDIMLPGQDGLSLCGELRKITFCPIIFISCLNDDEIVIRTLNMGGDDYLIKPFQASVLLACIEANLRRYPLPRSENETTRLCCRYEECQRQHSCCYYRRRTGEDHFLRQV